MHELSVAVSILSSLQNLKEREGFSVIRNLTIRIGVLSGVEPEALRLAMDAVQKNSILKDSEICLEVAELKIKCLDCSHSSNVKDYEFICNACGSRNIEIEEGESVEISELEVD